jgi:hypothetical protein
MNELHDDSTLDCEHVRQCILDLMRLVARDMIRQIVDEHEETGRRDTEQGLVDRA